MPESYVTEEGFIVSRGDPVEVRSYSSAGLNTGVVVSIGTRLVHIGPPGGGRTTAYFRKTRQRQDGCSGYFEPLAQAEERRLRDSVRTSLLGLYDIDFRRDPAPGGRAYWTTDELVALLEAVRQIKVLEEGGIQ